jgi:hypothetical protein
MNKFFNWKFRAALSAKSPLKCTHDRLTLPWNNRNALSWWQNTRNPKTVITPVPLPMTNRQWIKDSRLIYVYKVPHIASQWNPSPAKYILSYSTKLSTTKPRSNCAPDAERRWNMRNNTDRLPAAILSTESRSNQRNFKSVAAPPAVRFVDPARKPHHSRFDH